MLEEESAASLSCEDKAPLDTCISGCAITIADVAVAVSLSGISDRGMGVVTFSASCDDLLAKGTGGRGFSITL